jgi:hypothetical protein
VTPNDNDNDKTPSQVQVQRNKGYIERKEEEKE